MCRKMTLFTSCIRRFSKSAYIGNMVNKRTSKLKELLTSSNLGFLMEAHSGLSAKVVEETGFKAIWASGLSISAQLGVRDCNEASWTQVVDVLEYMSDAAPSTPILVDADTGYGNFNNARRLVKKLEQIGIAGMCIEDKIFPKANSLLDNRTQPLADVEEFALKIQACKDVQQDPDFCVVARVEAFIAGHGLEEALKRAEAYAQAGADCILMHSKRNDASEIESFMEKWKGQAPVVVVPTKYFRTPTEHFQHIGVNAVIWANHNLRASLLAMQTISAQIYREQSLLNIEDEVAPVQEVFRIQDEDELKELEKKYLPKESNGK